MLRFVTFAVKLQLNVHDLNNEGAFGNVTDIRIIEFLDEKGNKIEAPAVSGRMLKHWHLECMRRLIMFSGKDKSIKLCDMCMAGEPTRPGTLGEDQKRCAICDIHGYLITKKGANEENTRRVSRVMFSWLMPVLGFDTTVKQVLHTRVCQQQKTDDETSGQMIFSKSYASGIYAFVSALDVDRIGLVESNFRTGNPYVINDNERKERIKIAIEAYRLMISGQLGASLSHALPHSNPVEVLIAYSETGPLPFPVSPMYRDYIEKTVGLMPEWAKLLYWGEDTPQGVQKKSTINELFEELLHKVENGA